MKEYLVIHFDVEFIAGVICTGNERYFSIKDGKEDVLWLYFFNDPHQNRVTFGKENKKHYSDLELNYFGDFFTEIEENSKRISIRGIQLPIIELLESSGIISILQNKFIEISQNAVTSIPTLITFSQSISNLAKQNLINYLTIKGFDIESFTIPLSELASYYYWKKGRIRVTDGKSVIFMKATNMTLHLMKLVFSSGYFLSEDQATTKYPGKGFDPRKKAIVKFVVNEINKSRGWLGNQEEIEKECERLEPEADNWLKKLDATRGNCQIILRALSFSVAPSSKSDVIVRKSNVEIDTGYYIRELIDIFNAYKSDVIKDSSSISSVILLGNAFNNELIIKQFESVIDKDQLIVATNENLSEILSVYPSIDIKRYADTEERIKAMAIAEDEEKRRMQEAILVNQRKEEEDQKRLEEQIRISKNKEKALQYLSKAKELDSMGKLLDAIVNIETAKELDVSNVEITSFFEQLIRKKIELDIKTEQYKKLISDAKELDDNNNLEEVLIKYELAKTIFDSPDIQKAISETKQRIREIELNKKRVKKLIEETNQLIEIRKYKEALLKLEDIQQLSKNNEEAKVLYLEITTILKQQQKQYNEIIKIADKYLSGKIYDKAEIEFNNALVIVPNDEYCIAQLDKITNERAEIKRRNEIYENQIKIASECFENQQWDKAKQHFEEALKINPDDTLSLDKLDIIGFKIIELHKNFTNTLRLANKDFENGNYKAAKIKFEELLKIKPDDKSIKERLNQIKMKTAFISNKGDFKGKDSNNTNNQSDFFSKNAGRTNSNNDRNTNNINSNTNDENQKLKSNSQKNRFDF